MNHSVVSREEWLQARTTLLTKEKELTRQRDALSRERRELPWVKIETNYVFEGPCGKESLADLFEGRSQLFIYHFMFGPDWKEGCVGCSFLCDHLDSARQHFEHNDVSFAAVSRAPWPELEAFRKRMGWDFKWVSSFGTPFNYDFRVSFKPEDVKNGKVDYNFGPQDFMCEEMSGSSVFYKDASGHVFHTYSAYARGDEQLLGAYHILDMVPKGRNENGPRFNLGDWVRHHDRYDAGGHVAPTGRYVAENCGCAKEQQR